MYCYVPDAPNINFDSLRDHALQKLPANTPPAFHLFAGLGSGFSSALLLQPIDLLKTRVQQSGSTSLLTTLRDITSKPNPLRQLWRGTLPSTIRTSVGSALYFTSLNALRTRLAKSSLTTTPYASSSSSLPQLSFLANLSSGAIARASVGFIMMPITVIKVRFESSYYNYASLASAARGIHKTEGLRGFFAGFGATAIRDAPYAGLYVVFYEWSKRYGSALAAAGKTNGDGPVGAPPAISGRLAGMTSASINFTSSLLAASAATAITNPPDAIKTRLQLRPGKYHNTLQAARLMLKEEGVKSLFDGLALRMTRKALSSALAWTVYEEFIRRAESKWVAKAEAEV